MFSANKLCRRRGLMLAALFSLSASISGALATTYYVDAGASNDTGNGRSDAPKQHIASGIALMSPAGGDTLIIANGFYSHPQDAIHRVVNGRPGAYNSIKAAEDDQVTIAQPITLRPFHLGPGQVSEDVAWQYVQFEGLKWVHMAESGARSVMAVAGHHLKFLRSSFRGAGNCGNVAKVTIGNGDTQALNWRPTHHILLEDSWIYGLGGRYDLVVFHAEKIILRRVLLRHDGGWRVGVGCKPDPEANVAIYNSADVELQNVLVIDSELDYVDYESAIYVISNKDSGRTNQVTGAHLAHLNERTRIRGSVVLNSSATAIKAESIGAGVRELAITDSVLWNAVYAGLHTQAGEHTVSISNSVIGNNRHGKARNWFGINQEKDADGSRILASNNVIVNAHVAAFKDDAPDHLSINENNNFCANNSKNNCNPGKGALPKLRFQIGRSQSLFGEVGYAEVTKELLWPWPNEPRIRRDLSEVPGVGLRGWTRTGKSIGSYIASHLSHPAVDIEQIGLPADLFN